VAANSSREVRCNKVDLRIALGPALIATRGYSSPEVGQIFSRASGLAERIGRSDYVLPLLYGQWAYHLVRAEHRLALPFAERMEQVGAARNDTAALLSGRFYHGIVRFFLGEFSAARALFEQCHELRDPALRQSLSKVTTEDAYSVMLGYLALTLGYLGYFDQATYRVDEGLAEARRLQHVYTLGFSLLFKCWVSAIVNVPDEIPRHSDEMFNLGNDHGFPLWAQFALFYRGLWSTMVGQASDGVRLITETLAQNRVAGAVVSTSEPTRRNATTPTTVHGEASVEDALDGSDDFPGARPKLKQCQQCHGSRLPDADY
jgi:hypothetical protein